MNLSLTVHLTDVTQDQATRILSELTDAPRQVDVTDSVPVGGTREADPPEWSAELLGRLWRESSKGQKMCLLALAEADGAEVPIGELAGAISHKPDADWMTVAGTLGALGKRVYGKRYPDHLDPPYETLSDEELGTRYRMDPIIATHIRDAAEKEVGR